VLTRHRIPRIGIGFSLIVSLLAPLAWAGPGLLGIDSGFRLLDIDPATAVASNPRDVGHRINMIAYSPDGTLYGAAQGSPGESEPGGMLYTIDPVTGAATYRATLGVFIQMEGDIACDPTTGVLYGVDGSGQFFTINTSTGACTILGTIGPGGPRGDVSAIAFDPAGTLYAVESESRAFYKVDKGTGTIIESHPMGPIEQLVGGLAYVPASGGMIFASGAPWGQVYAVSCVSGAATPIGPLSGASFLFALTHPVSPTPVNARTWGRLKAMYR
jgi:hypothetical protein